MYIPVATGFPCPLLPSHVNRYLPASTGPAYSVRISSSRILYTTRRITALRGIATGSVVEGFNGFG